MKRLILSCILFSISQLGFSQQKEQIADAVRSLIVRQIGAAKADKFNLVVSSPAYTDKDYFTIAGQDGKICLSGPNGVSLASAFHYYLRHMANGHISWNGSRIPDSLPVPVQVTRKETQYNWRYYLNYCTYNYSMSWWDWERWEQEIDWMAMNGINMPLSVLGLNETLFQLYTEMGMQPEDLDDFFSGPAYFAWFWMGNLDGWGGPLPRSLMLKHAGMQKKILQRQRLLGMKPVLPAFSGHVPPRFGEYFPNAKIKSIGWNGIFPNINIIDPSDSLFRRVGKRFLEIQTRMYGTDHLYSADTFNEVDPPTNDSSFIDAVSKNVYASMTDADPKAVWVMQGWLFYFSRKFWKEKETQALLNAVPDSGMIVLDLWTEKFPVWTRTQSYYGKPWIWNMLNNFGGNTVIHGLMDSVAHNPSRDMANPASGKLVGLGLTMEAIATNPVVYEMMMENVWQKEPIDLLNWLKGYLTRRYGVHNESAWLAWQMLKETAYSDSLTSRGPRSMLQSRPTFSPTGDRIDLRFPYKNTELAQAWKQLLAAAPALAQSEGFRYDLVDLSRQVMSNHAKALHNQFLKAHEAGNTAQVKTIAQAFLQLGNDLDRLTATRQELLLGKWIADARALGETEAEKKLYEQNARNLITTWGDKNNRLHEYSARQWNGLFDDFYMPRWKFFFDKTIESLEKKEKMDFKEFTHFIKDWEWNWVTTTENGYRQNPEGDEIALSREMFDKYYSKVMEAGE